MYRRILAVTSCILLAVLAGCAASTAISQEIHDHVSSAGGSISVDPATGAITVSGTVGLKAMEEATVISNAIMAKNAGKRVAAKQRMSNGQTLRVVKVIRPVVNPCGQSRGFIQTFELKTESLWHRFTHWIEDCPAEVVPVQQVGQTPVFDDTLPTITAGPLVENVTPQAPVTEAPPATSQEDEAIVNAVLANGESEDTDKGSGDRAVVFGNNFPGTDAELHQCVNDAKKNILNLVKVDGFNTKNIRLFTDRQCTKANYEKWSKWALVDGLAGGRRAFFNSSHGAEDTDANGTVVDVLVTDDMVRKGQWDATTEVTYDFWYHLLRSTTNHWLLLNDSCHSGGQTRFSLVGSLHGRSPRSLDGPPEVQARLAKAIQHSNAKAALGNLTGSVVAVCLPNELASEGPGGGVGTDTYWKARKTLPNTSKVGDYIREANRLMKLTHESQHMTLIGLNNPLWN